MAEVNGMRRRLLAYLLQFGLEGKNINAYTWDEVGFEARNPITGEGAGFIPWPEGFDYAWFSTLAMVADKEDLRLAGLRPQMVH